MPMPNESLKSRQGGAAALCLVMVLFALFLRF